MRFLLLGGFSVNSRFLSSTAYLYDVSLFLFRVVASFFLHWWKIQTEFFVSIQCHDSHKRLKFHWKISRLVRSGGRKLVFLSSVNSFGSSLAYSVMCSLELIRAVVSLLSCLVLIRSAARFIVCLLDHVLVRTDSFICSFVCEFNSVAFPGSE